jgi:hypothetical protein
VLAYLQLHEEYHSFGERAMLACSQPGCTAQFFTAAKLNWHLYEAHYRDAAAADSKPPSIPVCRFCRRQFSTPLAMLVHRVACEKTAGAKRPVEGFPCARCGKVFTAARFSANHLLTCEAAPETVKAIAKTEPMAKVCKSEDKSDETEIAPMPRFPCDQSGCGKKFVKQVQLRNHLYTHTRYPYLCCVELCGAGFAARENYLRHARDRHPDRGPVQLISCAKCELDFASRDQLEAHRDEAHEEEEDDLLDDGSFYEDPEERRNNDDRKEKVEMVPMFACKMTACRAAAFAQRADLRRHYIVSHNETLVTCSKCNRKFGDREALKEHLIEAHGGAGAEPLPPCPFCGAEFLLKRMLKIHLVSQHPRPWSCPGCAQLLHTVAEANRHRVLHLPKVFLFTLSSNHVFIF